MGDRLRDIHDLQHVMTGYGRDTLGELCLLSFMTTRYRLAALTSLFSWAAQKAKKAAALNLKELIGEGREIGAAAVGCCLRWEDRLHELPEVCERSWVSSRQSNTEALKWQRRSND